MNSSYFSEFREQIRGVKAKNLKDFFEDSEKLKGLKSLKPILKLLYSLICSCLSYEVCQGNRGINAARNSFKLEFEDTVTLSAILFKELHERLLCCSDDASVDRDVGLAITRVDVKDSGEELLLLLRCCILIMRLHPFDQILTKQFQVVVALLRILCLQRLLSSKERGFIKLNKPISSQRICGSCTNSSSLNFSAQSSDLYLCFLQKMLEVYLDEVFVDQPFRECIAISTSSTHHLSVFSSLQIGIVLEVIAAHFLMSITGKDNVLQSFIESLIWTDKPVLSSPEVSLAVASSLINHPVMTSSPILLLSHLISLVSEVIGICVFPEKGGLNVRFVNIYLSTFCDSVNLYCEHMSKVMTGSCSSRRTVLRPFDSHFQSEIHDIFNLMHVDFDNAWREQSSSMFKKTIYSMAIDAISYLKMNLCIVDDTSRDDVFSFLSSLITRLISVEIDEVLLQRFKEITMQDFCLLASILKLMSSALLQATCCFDKKLSCLTALLKRKEVLPGYSSLAGLMSFFAQYNFRIPIQVQQFIVDALKPHLSTYEELELMLVHFAGFLLLCIVGGLHILMRGCLFFMLVLLNTLALESRTECVFPQATVSGSVAGSSNSFGRSQKTSSLRVASNFRRERRKLLREQTAPEVSEISDEETCNGERYLRCLLKNREDISELADFIECKPWRDYNARLMYKAKTQRRRFQDSGRQLQLAKMQVHSSLRSGSKRKLKRKACSSIKYL